MAGVCESSTSPAGVSTTLRPWRSSSFAPTSSSRTAELLGDGGGGVGKGVGGSGDRAALGDLAEKAKAFGIYHR